MIRAVIANYPERKTFWACNGQEGECDKIYHKQGWGLKHLVTAHDGYASLDEYTPEFQEQLLAQILERRES